MFNDLIMFVVVVIVMYMAVYGCVDRICKCFENCHGCGGVNCDESRDSEISEGKE